MLNSKCCSNKLSSVIFLNEVNLQSFFSSLQKVFNTYNTLKIFLRAVLC